MSRRAIPLREARAQIGHLVDRAEHYGETTVITRHGRPAAMLVPYAEESAVTTYTAAIGLVSSVVAGDFCDVSVAENDLVGYRNEEPEYAMGNKVVLEPTETTVRVDDEDAAGKVYDAADDILTANGWRRTGDWDDAAGDAAYAPVEQA